jgi:hypothetical protein
MENTNLQPDNDKIEFVKTLFQELKDEGYIKPERELVIVEKGDVFFATLRDKNKIFFNRNCPIPDNIRVLTLIILHEEGHKRYSQFEYVYTFWLLPALFSLFALCGLVLFLGGLLCYFINPNSPKNFLSDSTFILYLFAFFFFWLIIKYQYSRKYLRFDEINSDIYGAIGVMKKYNEFNPSLVTKASFDFFKSFHNNEVCSKNRLLLILLRVWYMIDSRYPSHNERIEIIHSLIDKD